MTVHARRPPEIEPLVIALRGAGVRYVVTGSVAAMLYGIELEPGDFDITPAMDAQNLRRLAGVLGELEAMPESLGHWETRPGGQRTWIQDDVAPEALAAWRPDVDDPSTFDHLFLTRYGNFDVVPALAGEYTSLMARAVRRPAFGGELWVPHLDDLLAPLTRPRRPKDAPRVTALRAIQRAAARRAGRT